jgi:hypothetical protein
MADEIQSSKVVGFAQRVLTFPVLFIDWEEFRSYYLTAILELVSVVFIEQQALHTRHLKQSR